MTPRQHNLRRWGLPYLESHGHWDGKTNKASSTTFGTNGDTNNALEFIANEGYYVYWWVQMGSGSGYSQNSNSN